MVKSLNTLLFILCAAIGLQAQTSAKEAKALLEKASVKMKSFEDVSIAFSYEFSNTRVNPPIKRQETGDIKLKGEKYRLNLMGVEQICDGKMLYSVLHEDEEVQKEVVKDDKGESQGLNPTTILDVYKKGFSYKLGGSAKVGNKTIEYVILKPTVSEEIDYITVGIVKGEDRLYSYEQRAKDGTTTLFTITAFEVNKKLADGLFQFNAKNYPGYYIPK
jgi:outer membrane lipoprotein-sorting protein